VERSVVHLSVDDAFHHLHVIGETGTGKSILLANWCCRTSPPNARPLTRPASGVSIPVARLWLDLFHNVHPDAGGVFEPESPLTPRFLT
jgi:hypothetical protein